MPESEPLIRRRGLLRVLATGLAALPLARVLPASAQDRVSESDPLARELGYHQNARQVDPGRYPKRAGAAGADQFCRTCQFFQGGAGDAWGPCTVFNGRLVNSGGWCSSWFGRAG